ncbi:DUF1830 domain-containing protein [Synechococcus sp. PCC 7336]|uniref:DUF1830 domain-containing protein n=1 Tax=Synechococcus sp. PCC 7336 TaxID=195250 RepID=UPI000347A4A0|nr:DUF1830 domain-containing protein [Synechococcus sp. PCC 7336]
MTYLEAPEPLIPPNATKPPLRLCYYFNASDRVQVAKLSSGSHRDWEKVVFPCDRILFDAPEDALLEVYASNDRQAVLTHRLSCRELACD